MTTEKLEKALKLRDEIRNIEKICDISFDFLKDYPSAQEETFKDIGRMVYKLSLEDEVFKENIFSLFRSMLDIKEKQFYTL